MMGKRLIGLVAASTLLCAVLVGGAGAQADRLTPSELAWVRVAQTMLSEIAQTQKPLKRAIDAQDRNALVNVMSRFRPSCTAGIAKLDPPPTTRMKPSFADLKMGCYHLKRAADLVTRAVAAGEYFVFRAAEPEVAKAAKYFGLGALRIQLIRCGQPGDNC
jgi:hypothetical protein